MSRNDPASSQAVALTQPVSKAAYDYWNALRNAQALPRRCDVDPASMRRFLPHVMLLERLRTGEIIFRLAGTGVCLAFGRELRDHSLLSLWDMGQRGLVGAALAGSLSKAAPLLLRFRAHAIGRQPLPGEMMLLPLLDDAGLATRLLASCAADRDPLGPKAFTRLELLRAEPIAPSRDRVELAKPSAATPRASLSLVRPPSPERMAQERLQPSMMRPWAGLFRKFEQCEKG